MNIYKNGLIKQFISLLFFNIPILIYSQKINPEKLIGIWQYETKDIPAGYLQTYQFFKDGRFIYYPSQFDYLKHIIKVNGHYKLENDSIFLVVDSTLEREGGYPSPPSPPYGEWEVIGGTVKEYILTPKESQNTKIVGGMSIGVCAKDSIPCILIGGDVFYEIEERQ